MNWPLRGHCHSSVRAGVFAVEHIVTARKSIPFSEIIRTPKTRARIIQLKGMLFDPQVRPPCTQHPLPSAPLPSSTKHTNRRRRGLLPHKQASTTRSGQRAPSTCSPVHPLPSRLSTRTGAAGALAPCDSLSGAKDPGITSHSIAAQREQGARAPAAPSGQFT